MRPILICALAVLSACVLHTKTPLFSDAEATPLLGSEKVTLAIYERKDGAWVAAEEPVIDALPEGNHYLVPDPATPDDMALADAYSFIAIDAGHYAVQAVTKGEAVYALATWDGKELLVRALDCDALSGKPEIAAIITFDGGNCDLTGEGPATALFARLLAVAPEPSLRLVRE